MKNKKPMNLGIQTNKDILFEGDHILRQLGYAWESELQLWASSIDRELPPLNYSQAMALVFRIETFILGDDSDEE